MSEIVIIKIERKGTRLATTLENEGAEMHLLAILQALGELSQILLQRHMEKVLDKNGLEIKPTYPIQPSQS